jgi:Ca-activated chloride channel family protein
VRFATPTVLWLLLALPLVAACGLWLRARRLAALRRFAGGEQLLERFTSEVSVHRRAVKALLVGLAFVSAILALARPQWGTRLEEIERAGSDVVVVLDTSLSMAAEDLPPNRLLHAAHAIDSLLQRIPGDRVALVSFAGEPTVNCPLTLDHAAVRLFLDAIDVHTVAAPGSALADALAAAVALFEEEAARGTAGQRGRAIVLFTDGEDHEGGLERAIEVLDEAGIPVHAVGCGTAAGSPIPLRDPTGLLTEYKKDANAQVVTTRLDEATLEQLALETGGTYHRATPAELEVEEVARALSTLEGGEFGSVVRTRWEERYRIPLAIALVALAAESLLGDRRRRRRAAEALGTLEEEAA